MYSEFKCCIVDGGTTFGSVHSLCFGSMFDSVTVGSWFIRWFGIMYQSGNGSDASFGVDGTMRV